ncbi:MAG: radical SAM protein, partial [Bdellovibrionales bacterium]
LKAGINRFSVGAQSFSDRLLKMVHREHNASQTIQTLELLKKNKLNFSFDLLFALPTQSLDELRYDLEVAMELGSKHISPYCLTVPEGHPLSKNRPLDEVQLEMFNVIHMNLSKNGFLRYEISNYAHPGFESKHNLLYWEDCEYWGLGLSAHSYTKTTPWGSRFWNLNSFEQYAKQIESNVNTSQAVDLSPQQIENLNKHQSLTDFCYTSLRLQKGLSVENLVQKFGIQTLDVVSKIAAPLQKQKWLTKVNGHYVLTEAGIVISNQIFEKFTFLQTDLTT